MPVTTFDKIINTIRHTFDLDANAEITLESNPGTIDAQKLSDFVLAGVNRLSVGVQRIDNTSLAFLGRRHDLAMAYNLLNAAQKLPIRLSADFIYGLPGDTTETVTNMCRDINKIGLSHVSMYELTIEENTPFGKMNLDMPTNEQMADMYCTIAQELKLPRYEVSNYAAPGNECRHNQNVWYGGAYIGIGRGAAGRININGTWYEQMGDNAVFAPISPRDRAVEMIITGMRTTRGVAISHTIMQLINTEFITKNPELVHMNDGYICATEKGMLILDDLLLKLVK